MMLEQQRELLPRHFDLSELPDAADFFKREGDDVTAELAALERQILAGLSGAAGKFEGLIPQSLLSELGAEIFDTLLSNYLKWYKCSLIAASQAAEQDCLAFAGYARVERPHHLALGITYEMKNVPADGEESSTGVRKISPIPGSVQVEVHASKLVRAAVAAVHIEKTVHHMLEDPADIVRKTLECRLHGAYGFQKRIGDVGLLITGEVVSVTMSLAERCRG